VRQYNGCRTILQGSNNDLPRVNCSAVKRPEKQVITADYPMLTVQKQTAEYLSLSRAQMKLQKPPGVLRAG